VRARLVIAVDGPAAAGKGTLARRLAAALGLAYLDTGLLYRAVGRRVLDRGIGPEADMAASAVAAIPAVRTALLEFQRGFGRRHGAVLDGRDIGTVVFPEAPVKLFVTASPAERARRRWLELRGRGIEADPAQVAAEIRDRDAQDANRPVAPLRPATDALLLDTTLLDAEAAFVAALELVRGRLRTMPEDSV
jgi:cytidylate kinase